MIVTLTQNQVAIIDDEDAEKVLQYKWQAEWNNHTKSFRASTNARVPERGRIRMHRLIMGLGKGDKRQVDHKNHNQLDNRKENLRVVTNKQNQQNRTDAKGYYYDKARNKWMVRITNDYHTKFYWSFRY